MLRAFVCDTVLVCFFHISGCMCYSDSDSNEKIIQYTNPRIVLKTQQGGTAQMNQMSVGRGVNDGTSERRYEVKIPILH